MDRWRLIDTGHLDGAANMAVDEALLSTFDPSASLPVLRLYGWAPPALSLGRYQHAAEALDLERCSQAGVGVVRRITGGGIIYHASELTYSLVCAPEHHLLTGSVKESFRRLTSFLLRFYRRLGLEPSYAEETARPGERLGVRTTFCFAGKESFDILVAGRKIGGNAQRRTRKAVFQHGSIPLRSELAAGCGFLRVMPEGVAAETTSLAEQGITKEWDALKDDLAAAFGESLGAGLRPDPLSSAELAAAERLKAAKYASEAWTIRGEEVRP